MATQLSTKLKLIAVELKGVKIMLLNTSPDYNKKFYHLF